MIETVIKNNILYYYGKSAEKHVKIPEGIVGIAQAAFWGHNEIVTIELPSSLETIGKFAFAECGNLTHIRISAKVSKIASDTFDGCSNLAYFSVDENNVNFKEQGGVLYSYDGETLIRMPIKYESDGAFAIPDGVKTVATNAFNRVKGIKRIEIPPSVESIGNKAFCYCEDLQSINIGKNVKSIGYCALANIDSLTDIAVDKDNQVYQTRDGLLYCDGGRTLVQLPSGKDVKEFEVDKEVDKILDRALTNNGYLTKILSKSDFFTAIDGVLFDKSIERLLAFPAGKRSRHYCVPDSVKILSGSSFQGARHLGQVVLGKSLTKIERHAFESSALKSLKVNRGLKNIGWCSFANCKLLRKIDLSDSSVEFVNGGAFSYCVSLRKISFPSTVNKLVRWTFLECNQLKKVVFSGRIEDLLFDGASFFVTTDEFEKLY